MHLPLVDSLEVLKLYKYIFDIQRLVDHQFRDSYRGGAETADGEARLVPISPYCVDGNVHPGTQGGGRVEWQDPVNLANARVLSLPVRERGGLGNFKEEKSSK